MAELNQKKGDDCIISNFIWIYIDGSNLIDYNFADNDSVLVSTYRFVYLARNKEKNIENQAEHSTFISKLVILTCGYSTHQFPMHIHERNEKSTVIVFYT